VLPLETAFLLLSIFSYQLSSYPSIGASIGTILKEERARNLSPLELARVFSFLAYNYF
jgi:hypothetical protein